MYKFTNIACQFSFTLMTVNKTENSARAVYSNAFRTLVRNDVVYLQLLIQKLDVRPLPYSHSSTDLTVILSSQLFCF